MPWSAGRKGLISEEDLEGVDLAFGKPEGMVEMVKRIACAREKLATLLGEGSREASRVIGRGAEEYAIHVKGLEFAMHDPRFSWGHAISYSTSNRGACHLSSLSHPFEMAVPLPELGYEKPYPGRQREGKAQWTIHLQHVMTILDSLSICKFTMLSNALSISHFREWLGQITGRDAKPGRVHGIRGAGVHLEADDQQSARASVGRMTFFRRDFGRSRNGVGTSIWMYLHYCQCFPTITICGAGRRKVAPSRKPSTAWGWRLLKPRGLERSREPSPCAKGKARPLKG